MRFILVKCADDRGEALGLSQWRATCAQEERTIDVFFWAPERGDAKAFIRGKYPTATFSDEVAYAV
jgi:hypothetical protein